MALTQLIVLGIVHALTEILPIGAAAHFAWLDGWFDLSTRWAIQNNQGLSLGLHVGLFVATAAYFWQDVADMIQGLMRAAKGKRDPGARLAFQLIVASLPMIAAVVGAQHLEMMPWRTPMVMAWTALAVSLLLLLFDRACMTVKRIEHAGYGDSIVLGIAQALAIVPGAGRIAAIVMIARALGYERRDAARFAFLISIPTLIAASAWNAYGLVAHGDPFPTKIVLIGIGIALPVALFALAVLMNWLRRSTFTPFAIYRLAMSVNLVAFVYGWI